MATATTAGIGQHFTRFINGFDHQLEPHVRRHVAKVYMVLAGATASAAIGSMLQIRGILDLGFIAAFASIGLILALTFIQDNGKNYNTRLGMLHALGFACGQNMGPLINYAMVLNPMVVVMALSSTFVVFASLTLAAIFAKRGKYLYLGGLLLSGLNTMMLLSLVNIFFKFQFYYTFELYAGLLLIVGFTLFDTQAIIEHCRAGERDVVKHALMLFVDVLDMFRRILVILMRKEEDKREERRKKR